MKDEKYIILEQFEKAVLLLEDGINRTDKDDDLLRDGTIQRFEFTYELAWKTIKKFLAKKGVIVNSPKDAFRQAFKLAWINDDELCSTMINARNLTVHTYNEEYAEEIFEELPKFLNLYKDLILKLKNIGD